MNIIIASPHFIVTEKLQAYTIEMADKLTHFDSHLIKCNVLLKIENSSTDDNKVCEMTATGDKKKLFASSRCTTFEEAVKNVVLELESQLRKQKVSARRDGEKMKMDSDTE
ncbi:MAG TPA: ribosome-associated translation inhibitor RaiA [Bacteroidia bacterium]|nr:ribosome-associated translation inhibitor RaiA [Bacteroidia bacterium]